MGPMGKLGAWELMTPPLSGVMPSSSSLPGVRVEPPCRRWGVARAVGALCGGNTWRAQQLQQQPAAPLSPPVQCTRCRFTLSLTKGVPWPT